MKVKPTRPHDTSSLHQAGKGDRHATHQQVQTLDGTDRAILEELQHNARIPFAELARRVHLSTPAVIERVRRLEDRGVLLGYRAVVSAAALGLAVRAFVKVTVAGDRLSAFSQLVRDIPEIIECHRVTGNESFLAQVVVRDMDHLEGVIDSLMPYVSTNTSIVLNSPVSHATLATYTGVAPERSSKRVTDRRKHT